MTRSTQRFTLALVAMTVNSAAVVALFFVAVPNENQRIMDVVLGLFLAWGGQAIAYYFGTSESSAHKTELLADRPSGYAGDPVHVEEE